MSECGPQIVGEHGGAHLVERLAQFVSRHLEGHPGMIATGQMIALRAPRPALALGTARQLLEVPMQFFDVPTHAARVLSDLGGDRLC